MFWVINVAVFFGGDYPWTVVWLVNWFEIILRGRNREKERGEQGKLSGEQTMKADKIPPELRSLLQDNIIASSFTLRGDSYPLCAAETSPVRRYLPRDKAHHTLEKHRLLSDLEFIVRSSLFFLSFFFFSSLPFLNDKFRNFTRKSPRSTRVHVRSCLKNAKASIAKSNKLVLSCFECLVYTFGECVTSTLKIIFGSKVSQLRANCIQNFVFHFQNSSNDELIIIVTAN